MSNTNISMTGIVGKANTHTSSNSETKSNSIIKIKNQENDDKSIPTIIDEEKNSQVIKGTIVAKIDNIYLTIKDVPSYFSRIRILLFLYSIFNFTFLFYFLSTVGQSKNYYYCFDPYSKDFKVCDQNDFCDNTNYGSSYIVFTDDKRLANKTVLHEIYNINMYYLNFFLKDGIFFSLLNTKFDKYVEVNSFYSIVFIITAHEQWNFHTFFNQVCNKQIILVEVGFTCLISIILGNVVYGFISDVYGRRRVLIFVGVQNFIGGLLIFAVSFWIVNSGVPVEGTFQDPGKSFTFDYRNETQIKNVLINSSLQSFESLNINSDYMRDFNDLTQMLINTQIIRSNFEKYKLFIFIGIFLSYSATAAGANISLAYMLENSINDTDIYKNYVFWHYSIPLGYLLHFTLLTITEVFYSPFIISASCILTITILIALIGYESPRHHYEFFEYKEITQFFEKILDKELLRKFYKTEENTKFRKELIKQAFNVSFCKGVCKQVLLVGYKERSRKYKEMILQNKFHEVTRFELLKNPNLLFMLINSNKNIKQHMLVVLSLFAIVGLIFFLTITKFNLTLVFTRDDLYSNIIVNSPIFYLCLDMCLSLYFFNFILKFFGYNIILFICFIMIFIFSFIFELLSLATRNPEDMNIFVFNSIEAIFNDIGNSLLVLLFIITFFVTGIYCTMYFYLTKLTKTLYRCTFYGFMHTIVDFTTIFSLALSQYFEKSFFYVSLLCVIGFVNAHFIVEEIDFNLVGDFRKIELEDEDD